MLNYSPVDKHWVNYIKKLYASITNISYYPDFITIGFNTVIFYSSNSDKSVTLNIFNKINFPKHSCKIVRRDNIAYFGIKKWRIFWNVTTIEVLTFLSIEAKKNGFSKIFSFSGKTVSFRQKYLQIRVR